MRERRCGRNRGNRDRVRLASVISGDARGALADCGYDTIGIHSKNVRVPGGKCGEGSNVHLAAEHAETGQNTGRFMTPLLDLIVWD